MLSNTPHPLDPSPRYAPKPVQLTVLTGGDTTDTDDPSHHACAENERGFELTRRYFI